MPSTNSCEELDDLDDVEDCDFSLQDVVAEAKTGAVECGRNYIEPSLASVVIKSYKGERNKDGFFHGKGHARFKEGHKYEGQFFDGHMHGFGKLVFANGISYRGQFATDRMTGTGVLNFLDGSQYTGIFENGVRHGYGKHCTDTNEFAGYWVEGIRDGFGTMTYPGGEEYNGLWTNNIRNGGGRMRYFNGNVYCGDFVNGRRHGNGVYYWLDLKEVYSGEWKEGVMHGQGEHHWLQRTTPQLPLQPSYVGSFENGKREGQGSMTYSNGACYSGEWHNNLKHGYGTFTSTNGVVLSGTFKENTFEEKLPDEFVKLLETPASEGAGSPSPQKSKLAMKCLITGGSRPKPLSPLNYLLGDIGVQGCKNIELSHTYNSAVTALLHGQDSGQIKEELIEAHTVILKYIDQLQMVYNHYGRLDRTPAELFQSHLMVRNQLWILCEDMKLHYDRTLADIDRLTWTGVLGASTIHDADLPVSMRDFLEWITFLAVHLYQDHESCKSSRFLLSSCLDAFLRNELGRGACANRNPVYEDPTLRDQGIQSKELIHATYFSLCQMSAGFRRPEPKIKGEMQLPSANDFMLMMKKLDLYDDQLTPAFAVEAITWMSPSAIHEPQHPNMDEAITLHQFLTAILLCATACNDKWRPKTATEHVRTAATAPVVAGNHPASWPSSALDRYAYLYQGCARRSAGEGSAASLDGTTSSRLSATPSQAGSNTASPRSSFGAAPSRRVRGSAAMVDSPVPEAVTVTSLSARSNISLSSTQTRTNAAASQETGHAITQAGAVLKWKQLYQTMRSNFVAQLQEDCALEDGPMDAEPISRDVGSRVTFFLNHRLDTAFRKWRAEGRL